MVFVYSSHSGVKGERISQGIFFCYRTGESISWKRMNLSWRRPVDHLDSGGIGLILANDVVFHPSGTSDYRVSPFTARSKYPFRSEEHTSELQSHSDLVC